MCNFITMGGENLSLLEYLSRFWCLHESINSWFAYLFRLTNANQGMSWWGHSVNYASGIYRWEWKKNANMPQKVEITNAYIKYCWCSSRMEIFSKMFFKRSNFFCKLKQFEGLWKNEGWKDEKFGSFERRFEVNFIYWRWNIQQTLRNQALFIRFTRRHEK